MLKSVIQIFKYLKFFDVLKFIFYSEDSNSIKSNFISDFIINELNYLLLMGKYILPNFLLVINDENISLNLKNLYLHMILPLVKFVAIILREYFH